MFDTRYEHKKTNNMFCQKCGNKIEGESKFCSSCGNPLTLDAAKQLKEELLKQKKPASSGRRLANYFIDRIGAYAIGLALFALFGENSGWIVAVSVLGGYHLFFESMWARTPGKWITKTKVVMMDGTEPGFTTVLLRTLCRFIPFEPFSFLVGSHPRGWHDRLTKTLVVPADYTEVDVKSIDLDSLKSEKSNNWIVIAAIAIGVFAIIGILASIVLASLSTARTRGQDAAIKAGVVSALAQVEIETDGVRPYTDVCPVNTLEDISPATMLKTIASNIEHNGPRLHCSATEKNIAVYSKLMAESTKYYCADNNGTAKETSLLPASGKCY